MVVTAAKPVYDKIRVGRPSERAMLLLRALSEYKYLCQIPSRIREEAKVVEPNPRV